MQRQPLFFQRFQSLASLPSMIWMSLFFLLPTLIIFLISFRSSDPLGGIGPNWTLDIWKSLFSSNYLLIMTRTLILSALTTICCVLLSVPTAYTIARSEPHVRRWLLLLVILPFWINFLIRIFAWKSLLHPDGLIKQLLVALHFIDESSILLYGKGAVLLIMIYSYLPFAVLPIYAAAEKFDYALLEAAGDLGASRARAFWKIFLPGIRRGIYSAMIMVFVPAMGAYIIPDMVGGNESGMISSKISQRVFIDRDLPQASALSALLTLGALLPFLALQCKASARGRQS